MLGFLAQWGEEAVRLGWTTEALFAVHPEMGIVRIEQCGALTFAGRPATAVSAKVIEFGALTFDRRAPGKVFGVPIWAFAWPKVAAKKLDVWR